MSVSMMDRVWRYSAAKATDLLIMLSIADFANDVGEAWPSVATLAKKSRLKDRATQYAIHRLMRSGELKIFKNKGPRGCHVYRITIANPSGAQNAPVHRMRGACDNTRGAPGGILGVHGGAPEPSENRHKNRQRSRVPQAAPFAVTGDPPAAASASGREEENKPAMARERAMAREPVAAVVAAWAAQPDLPPIRNLSANRRKMIATRLKDDFFARHYEEAIARLASSSFCLGENKRQWRADFDWLLKPDTVARIIEGKYDNHAPGSDLPANLVIPEPGQKTVEEVNAAAWACKMKERAAREEAERENSP
jgi:hypothetical protein